MAVNEEFSPKVSIVIPVYNGANFLKNAIDCALAQTYSNLEVIVVNDGSRDDGQTEKIALSYGDRIRYFRKENGGVSSALNYGIRNMTGEYFSWLSHDDAYAATKVADAVECLRRTPGVDERTIAYSGGSYIDAKGQIVKSFSCDLALGKCFSGAEMVRYSIRHGILNGCCMLIPKIAFEECGGFDESLRYSQDALMWYTLFFHGCSLVYDGKPNVMYRLHSAQTSQNRHDLFEHDAVYIAKKLAPSLVAGSGDGNELMYLYARRMAKFGCAEVVRTLRDHAKKDRPFSLVQNMAIRVSLLYSKIRGWLKKIYYRLVLKVKVR